MTAKDIQQKVFYLFNNHQYHLYNSYVYNWECDYFSSTKSNNDYEVEIKISRSDFFADFKKDKHRIFSAIMRGQTHFVHDLGNTQGDFICEYNQFTLCTPRSFRYNDVFNNKHVDHLNSGHRDQFEHNQMLNGYKDYYLTKHTRRMYAQASRIKIQEVASIITPNVFYYACPEGLIKPEEVPAYAGLIYISHYAQIVKKAPYMHKRRFDLTKVLLQKFYYETVRHRTEKLLKS